MAEAKQPICEVDAITGILSEVFPRVIAEHIVSLTTPPCQACPAQRPTHPDVKESPKDLCTFTKENYTEPVDCCMECPCSCEFDPDTMVISIYNVPEHSWEDRPLVGELLVTQCVLNALCECVSACAIADLVYECCGPEPNPNIPANQEYCCSFTIRDAILEACNSNTNP